MKKKASLWISGITTVAMLAVAVGSFAAWNKLSADAAPFSAKTDTRAELVVDTVASFTNPDAAVKLVPEGALTEGGGLYTSDKAKEEVIVGAFSLKLTKDASTNMTVAATSAITHDANTLTTEQLQKLEVNIYKLTDVNAPADSVKVDNLQGADANLVDGNYVVTLKFKEDNDTITSEDAAKLANLDDLKVKTTCTATKTV